MKLIAGHFYSSKDQHAWCCYNVIESREKHRQAQCIRLLDSRVEYFYLDGRYDYKGEREHTLINEIKFEDYRDQE